MRRDKPPNSIGPNYSLKHCRRYRDKPDALISARPVRAGGNQRWLSLPRSPTDRRISHAGFGQLPEEWKSKSTRSRTP